MNEYRIKIEAGATCTRIVPGGSYLLPSGRGMGLAYWGEHREAMRFTERRDAEAELRRLPSYLRDKAKVI